MYALQYETVAASQTTSVAGAWSVTTGAGVSVVATGRFA